MTPAYDQFVSPAKWRLALLAFALTSLVGAALAIALSLGAADPPRAANLVLNLHSADDLAPAGTFGESDGVQLFTLPVDLTPPFTIEMEASASGSGAAAWGIWLRVSDPNSSPRDLLMLIDNEGYALSALDSSALQHVQFIHIQPGSSRLYVDFGSDDRVTFRINDEIFAALERPVTTVETGGLALYGSPHLDWKSIKIYTGG